MAFVRVAPGSLNPMSRQSQILDCRHTVLTVSTIIQFPIAERHMVVTVVTVAAGSLDSRQAMVCYNNNNTTCIRDIAVHVLDSM